MDGRKLPVQLENPIDNVCLDIIFHIHPLFHTLGFTANGITILSALIQLIGVYCVYKSLFILGGVLYFIGYFFDVMDGWYARYYKMTSPYGDKLDHYSDILVAILLVGVIVLHPNISLLWKCLFIAISIALQITMTMYLGCQEQYFNKATRSNQFLAHLKPLCSQDTEKRLQSLRWFGTGTANLVTTVLIMLFR